MMYVVISLLCAFVFCSITCFFLLDSHLKQVWKGLIIVSVLHLSLCLSFFITHFATLNRAENFNSYFRECEFVYQEFGQLSDSRLDKLIDKHYEFLEYKNNPYLLVLWDYDYFSNVEPFDFSLINFDINQAKSC